MKVSDRIALFVAQTTYFGGVVSASLAKFPSDKPRILTTQGASIILCTGLLMTLALKPKIFTVLEQAK